MDKKTLEEHFSDFVFSLYQKRPQEMPGTQIRALRFAFMAGVVVTNEMFLKTTALPEDEAVKGLEELQNEINHFAAMIGNMDGSQN